MGAIIAIYPENEDNEDHDEGIESMNMELDKEGTYY